MRQKLLSFTHSNQTSSSDARLIESHPAESKRVTVARIEQLWIRFERFLVPMALLLMIAPIWISIGDHGFNGRSDARYADVSMDMARTGEWVVPHYMGRIHLTKPPLVYWLEGASIKVLGKSYSAVQIPSAIAGTLSLLLLFGFAKKLTTLRVALFAAGLYAAMPLTILPARMTVTDSIVNLCWMWILFTGFLRVKYPDQKRWGWLLILGSALGMLAKGPVLLIPAGLVGVWWIICRREPISVRSLARLLAGLILAMMPTLLWAFLVLLNEPKAIDIWMHETVDRAVGAGDHSQPIWFFVPIFFAGCFPASTVLLLPGLNLKWKDAIGNLRSGNLEGYLGWACLVPFIIYSLISGKLASYLLPICAPLALLGAMTLEHWFMGQDQQTDNRKLPEVRRSLFVGSLLYTLGIGGAVGYVFGPVPVLGVVGLGVAVLIAGVVMLRWREQRFRTVGLAAFLSAWLIGWMMLEEVEDIALEQMSILPIAHQTFGPAGWTGPMATYGFEDGMIYWDRDGDLETYLTTQELQSALTEPLDEPILVVCEARAWVELEELDPGLFARGELTAQWHQLPISPARYLIVFSE